MAADAPFFLDPTLRKPRPCRLADVDALAHLCDALPNMDFIEMGGLSEDVPPAVADKVIFKHIITNTQKVIGFGSAGNGIQSLLEILDLVSIVKGGSASLREKPCVWAYAEPISPLKHLDEAVDKLIICAQRGVPIVYIPMPQLGSSSPVTLAGSLAQGNAESLSGLVIHQLANPGAPFIFGAIPGAMDLRTMVFGYGSPELSLLSSAYADLAHFYHLPVFGTAGCGDGKALDLQIATEATLSLVMSALSGSNLIHDIGLLDQSLVVSPELVVWADEVLSMIKRVMGGVRIDDETLALNVIDQVGPGGEFMSHDHTYRHFREVWYPKLFSRARNNAESPFESETLSNKIKEKTLTILRTHQPVELPERVAKELDAREIKWLAEEKKS
jgi:trimethylamine--corrinoid protein Co-methyltransferase